MRTCELLFIAGLGLAPAAGCGQKCRYQESKTFTAVMFFFTLAEAGDSGKLRSITIPAQ